jgi:predicted dehydrogenase
VTTALRVGIVGAGWAGARHAKSLRTFGGTAIAGVVDRDACRADGLARSTESSAYATLEELIDQGGPDALIIATPSGAHAEAAIPALESGVAVYLEKPIARTLADADAIREAAERTGVACAVGYQWRAVDALGALRAELAREPPALLVSRGVDVTQARSWFDDDAQSGGLVCERGSHHIDLQCALAGDVTTVQAVRGGHALSGHVSPAGIVEDVISLTLRFASGALGIIAVVWAPEGYPAVHDLAVFTRGARFELELDPEFTLRGKTSDGREIAGRSRSAPFEASLADFLDRVRHTSARPVLCAPAEATHSLAVALACEQALACGGSAAVRARSTQRAEAVQ